MGEESGASLFKRELEAETAAERDEQVPLSARFRPQFFLVYLCRFKFCYGIWLPYLTVSVIRRH